jgi:mono/diheme cytochrome c family protein
MRTLSSLVLAAIVAAVPAPLFAQHAGDASRGHDFAARACAQCHAIEKSEALSPDQQAPAFALIARAPGTTGMSLNAFLQTPHANMPNLVLSHDEITDAVAYILSLQ